MTMERSSRSRRKQDIEKHDNNSNNDDDDDLIEVGFVEPIMSDSNIVTGQRLEDPPTIKIKKELGAFKRGSSSKKDDNDINNNNDDDDLRQKELKLYQDTLIKSVKIEDSTILSDIRKSLKRSNNDNIMSIHNNSKKSKSNSTVNGKKNNSTKNENKKSPKAFLSLPKSLTIHENLISNSATPEIDATALNNDFCSCCGMTGMFLCCESCPKSYHFQCINPPVDSNNLPDFWYCKECTKKKLQQENSKNAKNIMLNVGIYAKLFDNIIFQDPISFQLPKEIIESFQGISIDRIGDYNDESFKPTKTYKQIIKEFDDPLNGKYDKDGNPIFCYYCGESGFKNEIINCDYCSLSWHLDCLNIPMANIKKLGTKWKCPNHIDDLAPSIRKFKDQKIISISNIKNFEKSGKLPINANYKIINIEEKLKYFKNEIKSLHNSNNLNLNFSNLTFQLNEEDILLDFIKSTKIKKINENDKNLHMLMNLKPNLKDYVLSLSHLSKRNLFDNDFRVLNLQKLLKISDEELKIQDNSFSEDEIKEFLIIKKLIQKKGKDKLLKFLNSESEEEKEDEKEEEERITSV